MDDVDGEFKSQKSLCILHIESSFAGTATAVSFGYSCYDKETCTIDWRVPLNEWFGVVEKYTHREM